jgi:hypothetical protein
VSCTCHQSHLHLINQTILFEQYKLTAT